mmetsp:Transcript_63418/g.206772  ORF Transcript_63418/g.206772 Transcript_63418/m.206772 type:complete len:263 (+) Transcript_63418:137-925(+)
METVPPQQGMESRSPIFKGPDGMGAATEAAHRILGGRQHIRVEQQRLGRDFFCEWNNLYLVKDWEGNHLFAVKEDSDCLQRNCCARPCKAWSMDVFLLSPDGYSGDESLGEPFLHLDRPFTYTCCCLNRPQVEVSEVPSLNVLGRLEDPFSCCIRWKLAVRDSDNRLMHETEACFYQRGICCPWPCCGSTVEFPIRDLSTGQRVTTLTKEWNWGDLCPLCAKELSSLNVNYGEMSDPSQKLLMMSTALFIQMVLFDIRSNRQ